MNQCEVCGEPAEYTLRDSIMNLPSRQITKVEVHYYCEQHIPELCPDG